MMGATLTIEQMILNHNVGVSMTDADTLGGLPSEEFAKNGHKHDAADTTSGIFDPARLPVSTSTSKGIVQLTDSTDSTSSETAATAKAVNNLKTLLNGKASSTHKHSPADINGGGFTSVLVATANDNLGERQIRNIILGTTDPLQIVGEDGDIYFKYE
jgi:hypothetical protein